MKSYVGVVGLFVDFPKPKLLYLLYSFSYLEISDIYLTLGLQICSPYLIPTFWTQLCHDECILHILGVVFRKYVLFGCNGNVCIYVDVWTFGPPGV